ETDRKAVLRRIGRSQGSGDSVALDTFEVLDELRSVTAHWKPGIEHALDDGELARWIKDLTDALSGVEAEWKERAQWARAVDEHLGLSEGQSLTAVADAIDATATVINQVTGEHEDDTGLVLALREVRKLDQTQLRTMIETYDVSNEPSWPE